jgi:Glycosyl hydrolase family 10
MTYLRHVGTALLIVGGLLAGCQAQARERWSAEQAHAWYRQQPWLVGCNFIPSTAINQLEMWQADTFDPKTIDRELGWAAGLGFTSVRVFLHDLLWQQDRDGLLRRMEQFLAIADKHKIGVLFVLFDSVWDPFPRPGKQRGPKPHVHNSGWVQSPGIDVLKDPARVDGLKPYVAGVVGHFRRDRRVHGWDVVNEPDNRNSPAYEQHEPKNKAELGLALLRKAFAWAREVDPEQPLTAGVWVGNWGDPAKLSAVERFCLEESDVISFHNYGKLDDLKACVENLRRYGRPLLCTEFMARGNGSTFDPHLAFLREQRVAAYCWGFVAGKSQTIYPWDSWRKAYTAEPRVWFHDIFRPDGTPYDPKEVAYIKRVTAK